MEWSLGWVTDKPVGLALKVGDSNIKYSNLWIRSQCHKGRETEKEELR